MDCEVTTNGHLTWRFSHVGEAAKQDKFRTLKLLELKTIVGRVSELCQQAGFVDVYGGDVV